MPRSLRVIGLALGLLMVMSPIACSGKKVAATVNGDKIYVEEIDKQLKSVESQHAEAFAGEQGEKAKKEFTQNILDNLILQKLMLQQAKAQNIKVSDKELKAQKDQVKATYGGDAGYKEELKKQGLSDKEVEDNLKSQLLIQKIAQEVTKDIKVTDAQIKAQYEANKAQYQDPEMVKASQILVDSEETAKKIIEEYKDGANFADLAKKYSKDEGSKDKGGEVGEFKRGQMVKEFEDAAFSMKVGEVSDPIKSQFGYHIINVTGKTPERQKTLEEVKKEISDQVQKTMASDRFKKYSDALKAKADIRIKKF